MQNNSDKFVNESGFQSDSDEEDYMACADTAPLLEALQCGLTENLSDLERVVSILSTTLPLLCQNSLQMFRIMEARETDRERQKRAMLNKINQLKNRVSVIKQGKPDPGNAVKGQKPQSLNGFQERLLKSKKKDQGDNEYTSFYESNEQPKVQPLQLPSPKKLKVQTNEYSAPTLEKQSQEISLVSQPIQHASTPLAPNPKAQSFQTGAGAFSTGSWMAKGQKAVPLANNKYNVASRKRNQAQALTGKALKQPVIKCANPVGQDDLNFEPSNQQIQNDPKLDCEMQDEQHQLRLLSDDEDIIPPSPVSKRTTPSKAETQQVENEENEQPTKSRGLKFNPRVMMMASELQDDCMDSHELLSMRKQRREQEYVQTAFVQPPIILNTIDPSSIEKVMESPPILGQPNLTRNIKLDKDTKENSRNNDTTNGTKSTESETIQSDNQPKTASLPEATVVHLNTESSQASSEAIAGDKILQPRDELNKEYQFREVVRNREDRRNLKGQACFRCEQFYTALMGEDAEVMCNECSRHRDNNAIQNTPEKFYDLDA